MYKAKDGTVYREGDRVEVDEIVALPNEDGWGRELPYRPGDKTYYQRKVSQGKVVLKVGNGRADLEFETDCGWHRSLGSFEISGTIRKLTEGS